MLLFSIVLLVGTIVMGACSAQSSQDYLKLKGNILNEHKADVYVYVQEEGTDLWRKISEKKQRSSYSLRLATDKDYQVFFISNAGPTKVVHVKSGKEGMYYEYVDIDFEGSTKRHASLYQDEEDTYKLQTSIQYASTGVVVSGFASME